VSVSEANLTRLSIEHDMEPDQYLTEMHYSTTRSISPYGDILPPPAGLTSHSLPLPKSPLLSHSYPSKEKKVHGQKRNSRVLWRLGLVLSVLSYYGLVGEGNSVLFSDCGDCWRSAQEVDKLVLSVKPLFLAFLPLIN